MSRQRSQASKEQRKEDRFRRLLVFVLLAAVQVTIGLALPSAAALEPITVRSQSAQFVVRGLPFGPPLAGSSTGRVSYLRLDPSLTAVSLERIRQALAEQLGL